MENVLSKKPVLIIGGGVIGLSIGWRLQSQGVETIIFDRGKAGSEASWLSAGMLAPETEMGFEDEPLYVLGMESMRRWPAFVEELESASGMGIDFRTEGILHVAHDADSVEALRRTYTFQLEQGLEVSWLTGAEAREREAFLGPHVPAAVYSAADRQVDNRLLVLALKEAFLRAGGMLREETPVEQMTPGQTPSVTLAGGEVVEGNTVILSAGAWSRQVDGLPTEQKPPVRPVKGQMLQLQMEPPFELGHVVWGQRVYLAPKSNGRMLVGATVEEQGFDTRLTAGGVYSILDAAWEVVPGIYDLPITESWAGLRPGSRNNLPVLGPAGSQGIIYATGHYRNGILLAPITGDEIARLVMEGETSDWLIPFLPQAH